MQLLFDEEDDGGQETESAANPQTSEENPSGAETAEGQEGPGPPDASWGLGELLCVFLIAFFCLFLCRRRKQPRKWSKTVSTAPGWGNWIH